MAFFDRAKAQAGTGGATLPATVGAPAAMQPAPRELRAQAVHRLQVGLFGLAGMLLLIGLANIIMDQAQQTDAASRGTEAALSVGSPSPSETAAKDPLVDMGVAPELPVAEKSPGTAKPAGQ